MNRRQTIREKCLECSEGEYKEVKNCPCTGCSLYPFLTGKGHQNPKERDKAIRTECLSCIGGQPSFVSQCDDGGCPLYEFRGYNRDEIKPKKAKKVSPRGFRKHDLPEVIPKHQLSVNIPIEMSYMNKK